MNVVNVIRNSIVIVALREKEKENENVPRFSRAFPQRPEKRLGRQVREKFREWDYGIFSGIGRKGWTVGETGWGFLSGFLRNGWKRLKEADERLREFPSLVWKSEERLAGMVGDFPRWFEKCFRKPLEISQVWKRGQKQWVENIGMRSEAFRITDVTRLIERRKTGDELTSVIVYIPQAIFGAKKGLKMSGCALRVLETMICGIQG